MIGLDCISCAHAHPAVDDKGQIDFAKKVCKESPPVPLLVPAPGGFVIQAFFPTVGKGVWCGKHEPRDVEGAAN